MKRKTGVPPMQQHRRHLPHGELGKVFAMSMEQIKLSELTANEREVLAADKERWQRMGAGGHLNDWLAYGPGLHIRRRLAMRLAHKNTPEGKGYAMAFNQLMKADGIDTTDSKTMTSFRAVMWLNEDPERMTILRETLDVMSPGERSRLNSPITARQRVEKVLDARQGGTEDKLKVSPIAVLKAKLVKQTHEIEHLKERLAAAENDSSLFDLKRDSGDDIGRVIADTVSESKWKTIVKAATARFNAKQSPAG
jgi:hypothetical protein